MTRIALVSAATSAVAAVVIAGDGYEAPAGFTAVADPNANIGDLYNGTAFLPNVPVPALATLQSELSAAAGAVCASIINQVTPDQVHLIAVQNGFAAVMGNGGQAPTVDPVMTMFAQSAAVYGKTVAQFVPMVIALGAVSMALSNALNVLQKAAATAQSADDLTTALGNFETVIGGLVSQIQAAGVNIAGPDTISIYGIPAPAVAPSTASDPSGAGGGSTAASGTSTSATDTTSITAGSGSTASSSAAASSSSSTTAAAAS